ncbi:hypothetical protein QYM36_014483 [Artemia franciscana]|uniref:ribonuclease H n=1 Tax=Artemia franciscana TaxID=6661 RepID=A0AA88L0E6_ARTSF|nr:hypothetical protein QYM36_014483 [Artemia franciscana]
MLHLQDPPLIPPWTSRSIKYLTNEFEKEDPLNYIKFNHLMVTEYKEHLKVYTDGSKNNEGLDPSQSMFEPELVAIMKAGSYLMSISSEKNKILICSDSKSAIEALQSPKQTSREITTTQLVMDELATSTNTSVTIMWVPGHKNIRGNEEADIAAKKAIVAGLPINGTTPKIIGTIENMMKKIKIERLSEWRDKNGTWWANNKTNIQFERGLYEKLNREESSIMFRLRSNHAGTQAYKAKFLGESENCVKCGKIETIHHILIECQNYRTERKEIIEFLNNINKPLSATVLLRDIKDDKLAVEAVKLMTKFLKKIGRATAV